LHLVEEFFGKEVRIRIDPHLRSSGFEFCFRTLALQQFAPV
jgi:hypothetical protein